MIEIEFSVVGEANGFDAGILLFGQKLPWHQVGVMIHRRDDYQIAGLDVTPAPCLGDEVDRLGRVANEDNLPRGFGVDEVSHHMPGGLVLRCRSLGQVVHAAMDVGVRFPVVAIDGSDDLLGFLGAGSTIEERQPLPALLPERENWEILPYAGPINGITSRGRDHYPTSFKRALREGQESNTNLARDRRFEKALNLFHR